MPFFFIFVFAENPLVCVERMHLLQQGNAVFIPNSEDAICGRGSAQHTHHESNGTDSLAAVPDQAGGGKLEVKF